MPQKRLFFKIVVLVIVVLVLNFMISMVILVGGVLLDHDTVTTREQLSAVRTGLPFKFIVQNQSAYNPPLPTQRAFYSPLENPTQILRGQFFLSLVTVYVMLLVLITIGVIGFQSVRLLCKLLGTKCVRFQD